MSKWQIVDGKAQVCKGTNEGLPKALFTLHPRQSWLKNF